MLKTGLQLDYSDRREVLASYVHRYTGNHKPAWANGIWKDNLNYPLQFADDNDWLANTQFHCTKKGKLDHRYKECHSNPTWPNNPELRK